MATKSMFKVDTPQGASAEFLDEDGIASLYLNGVPAGGASTSTIAASPAPTYSSSGKLLTATVDGRPLVITYDANDNIATTSYGGIERTWTYAIGPDGNYHIASIV